LLLARYDCNISFPSRSTGSPGTGTFMMIAADKEIPYGEEAFSQLGQVRLFSGKDLKPDALRGVDALIVRTITPVNASLLDGTAVRYIGAASAGTDHVDQSYLKARGIHFCYAAGCNANSVSEYIVTVLHVIASRRGWNLRQKSLAIIGVGNVGSRVERKAGALGMQVSLCDPPLRDLTGDPKYRTLDEVLGADILTFHVPLVSDGLYPTWRMLDRKMLDRLSPTQVLINTSRGAVFDGQELKNALRQKRISGAIMDVWEEEPIVDYSLLDLADIGTPHIAGGALDGKIRATEMIREDLGRFLGIRSVGLADSIYPEAKSLRPETGSRGQEAVQSVLLQAFDILSKDAKLRDLGAVAVEQAAAGFERLRTERPLRLEFRHFKVELSPAQRDLAGVLEALGFQTKRLEF
jgi:erythronate-4-phosphate dehydrogenase